MDNRLVAWARAVKSRKSAKPGLALPVLWLFTDAERLADPCAAAALLPKGLCGVVLRHDGRPAEERRALGRQLARICRERRLILAIAGDWRLAAALRAGLHLRGGRLGGPVPAGLARLTSSAHGRAELLRAERAGVKLAFLSPAFATPSHQGEAAMGAARWSRLAGSANDVAIGALGGINGKSVRRLSRGACHAAGAIAALMPG